MSRNNVFKLSGNMALGSNEAYSNSDFENIKSSLKLLKSKQTQKRPDMPLEPTVRVWPLRICTGVPTPRIRSSGSPPPPRVGVVTYRYSFQRLPELL